MRPRKVTHPQSLLPNERKLDFQSDDEFLTYIQKAHFNYMWEGAEPTSGLACERIHTDGVYPENDADIVTHRR